MSPSSPDFEQPSAGIQELLDAHPVLRQWVEDREERARSRAAELQRRERQVLERSTDGVTGLRTRSDAYVPFERAVIAACGEEFDHAEWSDRGAGITAVDRCVEQMGGALETVVLFGDLAYLKAANRGGRHEEGDALLKRVGDVFRALGSPEVTLPDEPLPKAPIVAFRYGGDEFVGYIPDGPDAARSIVDGLQARVAEIDAPALQKEQLVPRIDVATATLREGIAAYRTLLDRGFDVDPRKRTNKIVDFVIRIADRRMAIAKLEFRVRFLMERRKLLEFVPERFDALMTTIARGENIQASEIGDFVARENAGEDVSGAIRSFVLRKLEEAFEHREARDRIEFEIVKLLANSSPVVA